MRRAGRCTSSTASDHVCCVAAWRRNRRLGEQEALICQVSTRRWNVGFPTVHASFIAAAGCADRGFVAVSLSLAAQLSEPGSWMIPGREVGEWWWFENSRAYLYYFFIVNDCQFVAGHADAWCRGIGQTAARFLCDAPFLIRRSSIFLFRESSCRCLFMHNVFFVEGSILAQDERWRRA